jgi:capsular polysaccharide biosynthesis protein
VIAITVVIAVGTVLLASGGNSGRASDGVYEATAIIVDPPQREAGPNLETAAGLVTIEEVSERVANRLAFTGDPRTLAERIEAVAYEDTELMFITARARGPQEAKLLADAFAAEVLAYVNDERALAIVTEAEEVARELTRLGRKIGRVGQRIDAGPADVATLRVRRQALLEAYVDLIQRHEELAREEPTTDLHVVQEAIAHPTSSTGAGIFNTLPGRLAMTILMALVVAVGLVFLFERLPRRVPPRRSAKVLSPLPVLGDVPLARHGESRASVTASEPKSPRDDFRYLGRGEGRRKRPRRVVRDRPRSEGPVS